MKRILFGIVMVALVWSVGASAQSGYQLFQQALSKEQAEGKLNDAIVIYQRIAKEFAADRALAAKALLRLGECYQKLGDAQARKVFEQVVRDYADQKDAVNVARARLGSAESVARTRGDRAVWTGRYVDMFGQVSPDGRFISYVDWIDTGNVMFHDVASNTDRRITQKTTWKESGAQGGYSSISRDGKQVAYAWETWGAYDDKGTNHRGLYIAPLQEAGHLHARQLFEAKDDVSFLDPYDWSPDGRWIALAIEKRKEGVVQIALASTADGSVRVLKTVNWRGPGRMFFSPDGRYITYDLSASETTDESHVFVMAVDGSRETTAVAHQSKNWPVGWPADGSRLLFASDRTGSVGLWSVPIADGRPHGAAELVKADIGSVYPLGLTTSGAMYVLKTVGDRDVHTAPIDVNTGKLLAPAAGLAQGFVESATVPDWSPDGKYLAYAACDGHCIVIRSTDTGQARRLRSMWYARLPRWSPDGRSLIVVGRDMKGRNGIFQVDAQTGQPTPIVLGVNSSASPQWSVDGKRIYYVSRNAHVLVERVLSSGTERQVPGRDDRCRPSDEDLETAPRTSGRKRAARTAASDGAGSIRIVGSDHRVDAG